MEDIVTYTLRAIECRLQSAGVPEQQCRAIAAEVDVEVRAIYGSQRVYVPERGRVRNMRDLAICDEYASGHSVATLAHRYQLTDRQIRRILEASPAISRVR